ncbi:hypothetical protein BGZ96_010905 [Linnemannia gamsii]|uniref:DNA (cytosine-5-)-methyltransferase n=1 Tax=Linnemannia gamsii TaxID=64522 RepID=A0ABQ7JTA7_9FUNG|nr:hypothetical protein BGZ96_010905 [Linnemannia gamsii]
MAMPLTLDGYYGEGYEEAERMFQQTEPDNYKVKTGPLDWLGPALGDKVDEVTKTNRVFYRAAVVDGVTIKVGEYMLIREDCKNDDGEETRDSGKDVHGKEDGRKQREIRMDVDQDNIDDSGIEGTRKGTDDGLGGEADDQGTWFSQVMYFYEEDGHKKAHVRYFSPGSQTILMEQSSWQELFLLDNCDEVDLDSVMGKFKLRRIESTAELVEEDTYFYRYWYDPKFCVFEGATEHESSEPRDLLEACICCDQKLPKVAPSNGNQISYHLHDFVYLVDRRLANYKPFGIGQITMLHSDPKSSSNTTVTKATVRLLLRHDDFLDQNPPISGLQNRHQRHMFKDCRRLVLTDVEKEVLLTDLEAKCRVRFCFEVNQTEEQRGEYKHRLCADGQEINSYKDQPDSFWFMDYYMPAQDSRKPNLRKSALRANRERLCRIRDEKGTLDDRLIPVTMPQDCLVCEKRRVQQEARRNHLCKTEPKLRAMDIFAGCGGMSFGLKQSGMVETEYSIEVDQDAAATFRHNFPTVEVLNYDAGFLLKQAILQEQEVDGGPTTRPGSNKTLSLKAIMPFPGEVDLIYCGPPCQGFTTATGKSNRDDPKNSLVATAMSYVDFYRPRYLLLENVKGFTEIGDKSAVHKKAFVKFVMRCLTELGYQCRIGMLQAGHFGVPQSRYRFFVWAAKLGYTLPTFPLPTTTFNSDGSAIFDTPMTLEYNDHEAFDYLGRRRYQAPDPMITVRDALSDLPGFEYIHPDDINKETENNKIIRTGGFARVNSLKENDSKRIGFKEWEDDMDIRLDREDRALLRKITQYRTVPQCEYQRKLRHRVSRDCRIRNHTTERAKKSTIETIYKFAMAPRARYVKGSRLDFDGFFHTVTSSADPTGSPGIVHPNQHRCTTTRERARAQGFPDSFIFPAGQTPRKCRKQIGNAVPPPLATALGGMLIEAMIQDMEARRSGRLR